MSLLCATEFVRIMLKQFKETTNPGCDNFQFVMYLFARCKVHDLICIANL